MAGPEFGTEEENCVLVVRSLYGLKPSGAYFSDLLSEQLHYLGYIPSMAEHDVWMIP